jgi:hypothetical protein
MINKNSLLMGVMTFINSFIAFLASVLMNKTSSGACPALPMVVAPEAIVEYFRV